MTKLTPEVVRKAMETMRYCSAPAGSDSYIDTLTWALNDRLGQQAAAPGVEPLRSAAINLNAAVDIMWNDSERYAPDRRERHAIRITAAQGDLKAALAVAPPPVRGPISQEMEDLVNRTNGPLSPPPVSEGRSDAEIAADGMFQLLETLNSLGGLGYDKHRWIKAATAKYEAARALSRGR